MTMNFIPNSFTMKEGRFTCRVDRSSLGTWNWEILFDHPRTYLVVDKGQGMLTEQKAKQEGFHALQDAQKIKKINCPDCKGRGHYILKGE